MAGEALLKTNVSRDSPFPAVWVLKRAESFEKIYTFKENKVVNGQLPALMEKGMDEL